MQCGSQRLIDFSLILKPSSQMQLPLESQIPFRHSQFLIVTTSHVDGSSIHVFLKVHSGLGQAIIAMHCLPKTNKINAKLLMCIVTLAHGSYSMNRLILNGIGFCMKCSLGVKSEVYVLFDLR